MGGISKEDLEDVDIIDAQELASDGITSFRSGDSVTSTTSGTKTVEMAGGGERLIHSDNPIAAGDIFDLTGSTAADGTYTVATVVDDDTFTVVEAIATSTGGTAAFCHPSGGTRVGIDPTGMTGSSATNLQQLAKDVDGTTDTALTDDVTGDVLVDDVTGNILVAA